MSLKNIIIHAIQQNHNSDKIQTQLRDVENPNEDAIVSLFTQLRQSFQKSSQRQYGLFDPEKSDNPLPGWLKQYSSESMSFTSITKKMTEHLKQMLDHSNIGFNAHLLFAVEELFEENHFYIFWINHTEAQRIDSEQDVANINFIHSEKLSFALKLDFNQWQIENWQQYLSLINSRGNQELSKAFMAFSGFIPSVNLQQQTEEFLNIVNQYTQTLSPEESNQTKNRIVDHCVERDMQGQAININHLSQELNNKQPDSFAKFVKENQEKPKENLYAHRSSLKKFVRFYGREKNLSISFSSDMMGDNVQFNPESGELTLKKLPKSLQQQLAKYLKSNNE